MKLVIEVVGKGKLVGTAVNYENISHIHWTPWCQVTEDQKQLYAVDVMSEGAMFCDTTKAWPLAIVLFGIN